MHNPTLDLELQRLLNSLNGNEKRYVHLYLSKHREDNNLVTLYKVIDTHRLAAPEMLIKKIKATRLPQLNSHKHILHKSVLDALHNFHLRNSPYGQIGVMLHQAEILFEKDLLHDRQKLLAKAFKMADKYELLELKLEVVKAQNFYRRSKKTSESLIENIEDTKQLCDNILEERRAIKVLTGVFLSEYKKGIYLSTRQLMALKGQSIDTLKLNGTKEQSVFLQFMYYRTRLAYHYLALNYPESYKNGIKLIILMQKHAELTEIGYWKRLYLDALLALLRTSSLLDIKTSEYVIYLADKEIKKLHISDIKGLYLDTNILLIYSESGEYEKGEKRLQIVENKLKKLKSRFDEQSKLFIVLFNVCFMHFGLENYSRALFWINEMMNSLFHSGSGNVTARISLRMMRLIVCYELKEYELLRYELRNVDRYIIKQKITHRTEKIILECIKSAITATDKNKVIQAMENAKKRLLQIQKHKTEATLLSHFDYLAWLESKIQKCTFAEVVKEKFRQKGYN